MGLVVISSPTLVAVSAKPTKNNFFTKICGQHTHYELNLSNNSSVIQSEFAKLTQLALNTPVMLKPFGFAKKNIVTHLKNLFFSQRFVRFLRKHMVNFVKSDSQNMFLHLRSTNTNNRLNFVLLNDKIVVTEIRVNRHNLNGIKKAADEIFSKHAVLANSQDVFCSGEMWFDRDTQRFMINCDSGTYRPEFERTKLVVEMANVFFQNAPFPMRFEAVNK